MLTDKAEDNTSDPNLERTNITQSDDNIALDDEINNFYFSLLLKNEYNSSNIGLADTLSMQTKMVSDIDDTGEKLNSCSTISEERVFSFPTHYQVRMIEDNSDIENPELNMLSYGPLFDNHNCSDFELSSDITNFKPPLFSTEQNEFPSSFIIKSNILTENDSKPESGFNFFTEELPSHSHRFTVAKTKNKEESPLSYECIDLESELASKKTLKKLLNNTLKKMKYVENVGKGQEAQRNAKLKIIANSDSVIKGMALKYLENNKNKYKKRRLRFIEKKKDLVNSELNTLLYEIPLVQVNKKNQDSNIHQGNILARLLNNEDNTIHPIENKFEEKKIFQIKLDLPSESDCFAGISKYHKVIRSTAYAAGRMFANKNTVLKDLSVLKEKKRLEGYSEEVANLYIEGYAHGFNSTRERLNLQSENIKNKKINTTKILSLRNKLQKYNQVLPYTRENTTVKLNNHTLKFHEMVNCNFNNKYNKSNVVPIKKGLKKANDSFCDHIDKCKEQNVFNESMMFDFNLNNENLIRFSLLKNRVFDKQKICTNANIAGYRQGFKSNDFFDFSKVYRNKLEEGYPEEFAKLYTEEYTKSFQKAQQKKNKNFRNLNFKLEKNTEIANDSSKDVNLRRKRTSDSNPVRYSKRLKRQDFERDPSHTTETNTDTNADQVLNKEILSAKFAQDNEDNQLVISTIKFRKPSLLNVKDDVSEKTIQKQATQNQNNSKTNAENDRRRNFFKI